VETRIKCRLGGSLSGALPQFALQTPGCSSCFVRKKCILLKCLEYSLFSPQILCYSDFAEFDVPEME